MSKETRQFIQQLKAGEHPSLVERLQESAGTIKDLGGKFWDGAKPLFDHGRTELAAALFSGHAHVMYMKGQESQGLSEGHGSQEPEGQVQGQPERQNQGREM